MANSNSFDPQADLDLLERSTLSVGINDALDFGPWWYAPLLATCMGGLTLFGQGMGLLASIAFGVAGFGSGLLISVHDYRRRSVRPKLSGGRVAFITALVIGSLVAVGLWGTAVSAIGYDDFVPGPAIAAWFVTTLVLLGIRQVCYSVLSRRKVLA